ncbi:MAG: Ig-like domain-containing protein [Candidatus Diapherotrites archaeon]
MLIFITNWVFDLMEQEQLTISSDEFKALSSEARTEILKSLYERRHTLTELAAKRNISLASMKRHLELLEESQLIHQIDEGRKWKYYELTEKGKKLLNTQKIPIQVVLILSASVLLLGFMFILGSASLYFILSNPMGNNFAVTDFIKTNFSGLLGTDAIGNNLVSPVQEEINFPPEAQNQAITAENSRIIYGAGFDPVTYKAQTRTIALIVSDPENNDLNCFIDSGPEHGTAVIQNCVIFYTPNISYLGADFVNYYAFDGKNNSGLATITIAVVSPNHKPIANSMNLSTAINNSRTLTLNASDSDNDALTCFIKRNSLHGTSAIQNCVLTYVPDANFSGTDLIEYYASDGKADSDTAEITITVTTLNANNPPTASVQSKQANKNMALVFDLDVHDSENDLVNCSVNSSPQHGTLIIDSYTWATGCGATYSPDANFSGTDYFTYSVSDNQYSVGPVQVTILVSQGSSSPVGYPQSVTVNKATPIAFALNVFDADGDALTCSVNSSVSHGTLSINNCTANYHPVYNYSGTDYFTYKVSDGQYISDSVRVDLTVLANAVPIAYDMNLSVSENNYLVFDLNTFDPDGTALNCLILSPPAHGNVGLTACTATYTPFAGFAGTDSFTYHSLDGVQGSNTGTVSIQVIPVTMKLGDYDSSNSTSSGIEFKDSQNIVHRIPFALELDDSEEGSTFEFDSKTIWFKVNYGSSSSFMRDYNLTVNNQDYINERKWTINSVDFNSAEINIEGIGTQIVLAGNTFLADGMPFILNSIQPGNSLQVSVDGVIEFRKNNSTGTLSYNTKGDSSDNSYGKMIFSEDMISDATPSLYGLRLQGQNDYPIYYAVKPAKMLNRLWLMLAVQSLSIKNSSINFSGTSLPNASGIEDGVIDALYYTPKDSDFDITNSFTDPAHYLVAHFIQENNKYYIDTQDGQPIGSFTNSNLSYYAYDALINTQGTSYQQLKTGSHPSFIQETTNSQGEFFKVDSEAFYIYLN